MSGKTMTWEIEVADAIALKDLLFKLSVDGTVSLTSVVDAEMQYRVAGWCESLSEMLEAEGAYGTR